GEGMMRRRALFGALLALTMILAVIAPAGAITNGELDEEGHPYVGLMVADDADGNPLWRCSGTLMSSTLFLTAGHCTEAPAVSATIWFDADVESGIPGNGYPFDGDVDGTTFIHPNYNPNAFFLYDLGVVVLDEPVVMDEYGALPEQDVLDAMATKRGKQDTTFTAVGYGLQRINPVFVEAERVRMVAYPKLNQINAPGFTGDFSLLLSNNHSTGGTCFGDSGGPNFINDTNIVGGVTSFGLNGNCAGTGGVYRVDRADDLDWLATFGLTP
ncbi:MAG: S1 family peptidase, partial [Actinomycetota bacterium]|nr:S1 family peptidase [Actinomycetota bacterium]